MTPEAQKTLKDVVYLVAFLMAAVAFTFAGDHTLAGAAIGAASTYAVPESVRMRVPGPALALLGALVVGSALSGCTAGGAIDWHIVKGIVRTSCRVADVAMPAGETSGGETSPMEAEEP